MAGTRSYIVMEMSYAQGIIWLLHLAEVLSIRKCPMALIAEISAPKALALSKTLTIVESGTGVQEIVAPCAVQVYLGR